jgi:hypothetical protein
LVAGIDYEQNSSGVNGMKQFAQLRIALVWLALAVGLAGFVAARLASAQDLPLRSGAPPLIQFAAAGYAVTEDSGVVTVTVGLSQPATGTVSVAYATADGSATGSDYSPVSGTLNLASGDLSATLTLSITADPIYEAAESFEIALSDPDGAVLGEFSTAAITIENDDLLPTARWSADNYVFAEGIGTAAVTVTLSNPSAFSMTLPYTATDGTAVAEQDYARIATAVECAAEQTECLLPLLINDDALTEPDEQFSLTIGGSLAMATVTILDNELPVIRWQRTAVRIGESAPAVILTAYLSRAYQTPVTVRYATSDGLARANQDYVPISGTLNFPSGQTTATLAIQLVQANLMIHEQDETFFVQLSEPVGASVDGGLATVLIADNSVFIPRIAKIPLLVCPVPNEPANNSTAGAGNLLSNGQACRSDFAGEAVQASDYYAIGLNQAGSFNLSLSLKNTTTPPAHDIDLFLYQRVGDQLQFVAESRKVGQLEETINVALDGQGKYFVRVYWYEATANAPAPPSYALTAVTTP